MWQNLQQKTQMKPMAESKILNELITKVTEYEENTDNPSLGRIFEEVCFGFRN